MGSENRTLISIPEDDELFRLNAEMGVFAAIDNSIVLPAGLFAVGANILDDEANNPVSLPNRNEGSSRFLIMGE